MKTYFQNISFKDMVLFYYVSWMFLVGKATEAQITSYILEDVNLMVVVVEAYN
jgi:hypothetical protein